MNTSCGPEGLGLALEEGEVLGLGEILGEADDEGLGEAEGDSEEDGLILGLTELEGEIAGAPETERISIVPVAVGPAAERVKLPLDTLPPRLKD